MTWCSWRDSSCRRAFRDCVSLAGGHRHIERCRRRRGIARVGTVQHLIWKRSPALAGPFGHDLVTVTFGAAFREFVIVQVAVRRT